MMFITSTSCLAAGLLSLCHTMSVFFKVNPGLVMTALRVWSSEWGRRTFCGGGMLLPEITTFRQELCLSLQRSGPLQLPSPSSPHRFFSLWSHFSLHLSSIATCFMFGFVCPLIVVSFGIIYGLPFLALLPQIAFTKHILLLHQNTVEENISLNMDEFKIKTEQRRKTRKFSLE